MCELYRFLNRNYKNNKKFVKKENNLINKQIDEIFEIIEKDYRSRKKIKRQNIEFSKMLNFLKNSFLLNSLKNIYDKFSFYHFILFPSVLLLLIVVIGVLLSISDSNSLYAQPDLVKKIFAVFVIICLIFSFIFTVMSYIKIFSEVFEDGYPYQLNLIKEKIKRIRFTENSNFFELYDKISFKSVFEAKTISLQACISCFELYVSTMKEDQNNFEKISFIFSFVLIISTYVVYGNLLEIKEITDIIKFYPLFVVIDSISKGLFYWRYHIRIQSLQESLFLLNNLQLISLSLNS